MTVLGDAREPLLISDHGCHFFPKRIDGRFRAMIKDKACLAVANEIAETSKIGNKHHAAVRHGFERRESK